MSTIDSGNIRIWYALNAVDIDDTKTYDDCQYLEIGTNISKYYSYFVSNSDFLCADWGEKHPLSQVNHTWLGPEGKAIGWSEYYWSEYFKNISSNFFTEYARMPYSCQNYWYSENIPVQEWEVQNDTLTILGYLSQKATCRFRGRDFTAWFTVDIPINNGPWKFGGLPGLIMKVYDNDKLYVFECIKIEYTIKKYPIEIYNYKNYIEINYKNYIEIEREKLLKLQKNIHEAKMGSTMPISVVSWRPYHPLELE
jgi:GLPGLI family protein